jgi:hypothetical protein
MNKRKSAAYCTFMAITMLTRNFFCTDIIKIIGNIGQHCPLPLLKAPGNGNKRRVMFSSKEYSSFLGNTDQKIFLFIVITADCYNSKQNMRVTKLISVVWEKGI